MDIRVGDLGDEAFLDSAMAGVDEVLHISSIFHSLAVAKAMAANGVGKGDSVHTTGVFSRFKQASQDYKEIEAQVLQRVGPDADLTFLRPTMIYGRVDDQNMIVFIRLIDRLPFLPVVARGRALVQPVNARDLRAYYQVITSPAVKSGDYVLSGDRPRSMREMFTISPKRWARTPASRACPMRLHLPARRRRGSSREDESTMWSASSA